MEESKKSLDAAFFNNLYQQNQDPWNFDESEYEKNKYEQTMKLIPKERYENVFEIGCSNGAFTLLLVQKCEKLLAVDSSSIAVENAKKRLSAFPQVLVREMEIPKEYPDDKFDLILLSEVGYFLTESDLAIAKNKMIHSLVSGGNLILVHWTPFVEEFPLTGDQVHEVFLRSAAGMEENFPLRHLSQRIEPQFRMDLFEKK